MVSDLKAGEFSQVQEVWHEGDPWARKTGHVDLLWGSWTLAASQGEKLDQGSCEGQGRDVSGIPWKVHSMGLIWLTWHLWTQREPEKGPLDRSPGGGRGVRGAGFVVACVCAYAPLSISFSQLFRKIKTFWIPLVVPGLGPPGYLRSHMIQAHLRRRVQVSFKPTEEHTGC